jgi:polyvinyl alcohol dehydrogenase (cytochrome)
MYRKGVGAVALLAVALAAHSAVAGAATAPTAAETLGNQHANLTAGITSANVHSLRAAWFVRTAGPVSATPIVWRASVLFSDWSGRVWRVNALTGKTIWKRRLETPDTTWPWYGLAGTGVVARGVLVEVGVEGNAWGLNATTGKILWGPTYLGGDPNPNVMNPADPNAKYVGNLSDLLYGDGLVYVGMSSCEEPFAEANPLFIPTARGSVIALDPATGTVAWQTWLALPGDTGVPVWSSFALDSSTGILYTDTGNNYTSPATAWSDAVLALDATTGTPVWETQLTVGDTWPPKGPDNDFGAGPQLFTAPGPQLTTLRLVGAMQKDGLYTALNRATGAIVWQRRVATGEGGSRGEASVGLSRLFAWADGKPATGAHRVTIAALAPASGVPIWRRVWSKAYMFSDAGFLSHGVYFVGDATGSIRAYRNSDGKLLWQGATPGHAPVCSSLWVAGRYLYVGIGLTNHSKRAYGLAAYRVP